MNDRTQGWIVFLLAGLIIGFAVGSYYNGPADVPFDQKQLLDSHAGFARQLNTLSGQMNTLAERFDQFHDCQCHRRGAPGSP